MAFDGAFLSCLRAELQDTLRDARIDKIHQPSREELVLSLRRRNGRKSCIFRPGPIRHGSTSPPSRWRILRSPPCFVCCCANG